MDSEEIVVQNGELFGKGRADLRNEQMKELIREWEKQRDELLDELSFIKGQVDILEKLVAQSYERMLKVNKEEQAKEQVLIDNRLEQIKELAATEAENQRNKDAEVHHLQKQADVKAGKRKGKTHPSERGRELQTRKRNKT